MIETQDGLDRSIAMAYSSGVNSANMSIHEVSMVHAYMQAEQGCASRYHNCVTMFSGCKQVLAFVQVWSHDHTRG